MAPDAGSVLENSKISSDPTNTGIFLEGDKQQSRKITMRRFFMALKTITVGVGLLSVVACSPSVEEQVAAAYEDGYGEGYSEGQRKG